MFPFYVPYPADVTMLAVIDPSYSNWPGSSVFPPASTVLLDWVELVSLGVLGSGGGGSSRMGLKSRSFRVNAGNHTVTLREVYQLMASTDGPNNGRLQFAACNLSLTITMR